MMQSLKYPFVLLAFIAFGVMAADLGKSGMIDRDFSLAIGKTVEVEGEDFYIRFKAVPEDSRCPANALCTSQGNAQVQLEILGTYDQHQTIVLNTDNEPKAMTVKGHRVILIALNPSRIDGESISAGDYAVTLRVESPAD